MDLDHFQIPIQIYGEKQEGAGLFLMVILMAGKHYRNANDFDA